MRENYIIKEPPFIWPEARYHEKQKFYQDYPPFKYLIYDFDLISGILTGVTENTIKWIYSYINNTEIERILKLIILVYPACPTRKKHLVNLMYLQNQLMRNNRKLEIKILPVVDRIFGVDYETIVLPPSIIHAYERKTSKTLFLIGTFGDFDPDSVHIASFNVVFQPDDLLRDEWRKWFQYLFEKAAPLTPETAKIPYLIPVEGDSEAYQMWRKYEAICQSFEKKDKLSVDITTNEVITGSDGKEVKPWDNGITALNPLAQKINEVYSKGYIVTIDETTRLKPLNVPIKAYLLGQMPARYIGVVTHKQTFSIQILDWSSAKLIEKCRKITDAIELLSYMLSKGNRWISKKAKILLDKEIDTRNKMGQEYFESAIGKKSIQDFIESQKINIRKDLDKIYKELGKGATIPEDKFREVLSEIEKRFTEASKGQITPRVIYNKILPPDLTDAAPMENWSQPYLLLLRSARLLREALTDIFFKEKLNDMSFRFEELLDAMDIFEDKILKDSDKKRAEEELNIIKSIEDSDLESKDKCVKLWQIISGNKK